MGHVEYQALTASATSSGSITTYSNTFTGYVQAIRYSASQTSTGTGISSGGGSVLTVATEKAGLAVLSLADASSAGNGTYYVRGALSDTGGASTSIGGLIPLHNERLSVTIASGSTTQDTKYATLHIFVS